MALKPMLWGSPMAVASQRGMIKAPMPLAEIAPQEMPLISCSQPQGCRPVIFRPMSAPSHLSDLGPAPCAELGSALRLTRQRREVYDVLLEQRDHPTVQEVFARAKERMPRISLATVYNCLEALMQVGLVRQVNLHRSPSRFCPNLSNHAHFHCDACGQVSDIPLEATPCPALPAGAVLHQQEITLRGLCPHCASPSFP